MFVLYSQNYAATALSILFKTPKKLLLKSSYPKKYLPNFCTQKNPGIENFKPRKILRSSRHLKFRVPPWAKNLKNHTLFRGKYLYSPHMGVPPPPGVYLPVCSLRLLHTGAHPPTSSPGDEVAEALQTIPFHCHTINTAQKKSGKSPENEVLQQTDI